MQQGAYEVVVGTELADLIPGFMANRNKELHELRSALSQTDFAGLRLLGHRMKGVGASYGFTEISALGKQIEEAAKAGNAGSVGTMIDAYEHYLARVSVSFA